VEDNQIEATIGYEENDPDSPDCTLIQIDIKVPNSRFSAISRNIRVGVMTMMRLLEDLEEEL
jgi:hypothetical protein